MGRTLGRVIPAAVAALAFAPVGAHAQDFSLSSAFEAGGDEVYVLYTQPSWRFGPDVGWSPEVGVGAYHVWTENGNGWGLTPAVGLGYRTTAGMIRGTLGWAIRDDDDGVDVFGGDDNGVHTGLHAEYWGDGTWGAQGIATYNWGDDFLWSRARLTRRVSGGDGGTSVALGGELVWQSELEDDDTVEDNEFEATYIGPVLQIIQPNGMNWAISGGLKAIQPNDDDTWYAKVELYLP